MHVSRAYGFTYDMNMQIQRQVDLVEWDGLEIKDNLVEDSFEEIAVNERNIGHQVDHIHWQPLQLEIANNFFEEFMLDNNMANEMADDMMELDDDEDLDQAAMGWDGFIQDPGEIMGFIEEFEDDLEDEEASDASKSSKTTFELNDTLYAEAELEDSDTVYLWLGVRRLSLAFFIT